MVRKCLSGSQFQQQFEDKLALLQVTLSGHLGALVDTAESTAHFVSTQVPPGGQAVISGLQVRALPFQEVASRVAVVSLLDPASPAALVAGGRRGMLPVRAEL